MLPWRCVQKGSTGDKVAHASQNVKDVLKPRGSIRTRRNKNFAKKYQQENILSVSLFSYRIIKFYYILYVKQQNSASH